jgi:hypothetical protein
MGPRDEFRSSYRDSTRHLVWALVIVSVIALAAVVAAVTLWLRPRPAEQSRSAEPQPTEPRRTQQQQPANVVPRADLEQITGQDIRLKFPGPPVRITCPADLPVRIGASVDCALRRGNDNNRFRLTLTITKGTSPINADWSWRLGDKIG